METLHLAAGTQSSFIFQTQSSHEIFLEALYLVFACICNRKGFKVIKFCNIYDISCYIQVKAKDVVA